MVYETVFVAIPNQNVKSKQ